MELSWADDAGETGKWPGDYVHENVVSWGSEWPVPRGRESISKWDRFNDESNEILEYELSPLTVIVEGNTGVVHYSVVEVTADANGERKRTVNGIVETLHRSNGTWKFISLTGFEISSDE